MSASEFRLPDGTWSCTRDGVTGPCGDCDGCRWIAGLNAAGVTEHPSKRIEFFSSEPVTWPA